MGQPRARLPIGVQINQVSRLLSAPCQGKWSLAIETALPALGNAMYVLLTPDAGEILQNYLRPKGARGGTRFLAPLTRKRTMPGAGRSFRMWGGGFPDVDQSIGDALPGRKWFAGRSIGSPEKWMWSGLEFADTIGWYWLLFSVASDGLSIWSSNLFHSLVCHPTSSMAGSWTRRYTTQELSNPWNTGFEGWLHEEKNCNFGALGLFRPADLQPLRGFYMNCFSGFQGSGYALTGPFHCTLWDGGVKVFDAFDGSAEALDSFELGNLQVEGHFEYDGVWTHGFIDMTTGTGSGFHNTTADIEGQIFGGFGPV